MAQFEKWFTQDLKQNIEIRHCEQITFTGDNLSNVVGVNLFVDGEPYDGGGNVTATVVLSNGATVALENGVLDGNQASVTLTSGCFICPGLIGVYIRLTNGDIKTTVLSAVFTVIESETGSAVDPGTIIPSVQDLIDDIADAVATIPPDYSALLATIAPTFSASTAYSGGSYVWYDSVLYRFTADHAAGAWTGTDAMAVVIGEQLDGTARETTLEAVGELVNYGAGCMVTGSTTDGLTVLRTGTTFKINGTNTNSSAIRFRMYSTIAAKRGGTPSAEQNKSGGALVKAGHTYRLWGRLLSGTYTDPETAGSIPNWRLNAFYQGTTTAWDSTVIFRDGANYLEECTPDADGEICIWIAILSGSTFADGVIEVWLEDVTASNILTDYRLESLESVTGDIRIGGSEGTASNRNCTLTRERQIFTFNRDAAHSSQSSFCLLPYIRGVNYDSSGSNLAAYCADADLPLKDGHMYRLIFRVLSGSVAGGIIKITPRNETGENLIGESVNGNSGNYFAISDGNSKQIDFLFRGNYLAVTAYVTSSFYTGAGNSITFEMSLVEITDTVLTETTPIIYAGSGMAYNCTAAYLDSLTFYPCEYGICSVRFKSGTTPTVLTLPNAVKMPDWWTGVEASRTYEISIADGVYGVVTSWA